MAHNIKETLPPLPDLFEEELEKKVQSWQYHIHFVWGRERNYLEGFSSPNQMGMKGDNFQGIGGEPGNRENTGKEY